MLNGLLALLSLGFQYVTREFGRFLTLSMNNLVPRVLYLPSPGARERETLENAGHVSPRTSEMTKHNLEGRTGKSGVMVRICSPSLYVIFCHLPDSERHVTSVFQGLSLSLSLSLAPGNGKERTLGTSFIMSFITDIWYIRL